MSTLQKVILFEAALWSGLIVILFFDINPIMSTAYFVGLGFTSFLIRCKKCGKGVFVREWFGASLFVVPWPNSVCTRCGTVLIGKRD